MWNLLSLLCVTSAIRCLHDFFKARGSAVPFFKNAIAEDKQMTWHICPPQLETIPSQISHLLVILGWICPLYLFVKQCYSANKGFVIHCSNRWQQGWAQSCSLMTRYSSGREETCYKDCLWISLRDYLITTKICYLLVSVGKKARGWELSE